MAAGLAGLSGRERLLIGLMAGVVAPVAVVIGVLLPLHDRLSVARADAAAALDLRTWVHRRIADLPPDAGLAQRPSAVAAIGIAGLEQTLVQAGLRAQVTRLANRPGGGIDLGLEGAGFSGFATWLAETEAGAGYSIAALRIDALAAPGTVRAVLVLEPVQ
jgi:type II secretory pathway component PulM